MSEEIMISGSMSKNGSIVVSGAKNAALPLMAACLLTDENVTLSNIPQINDVKLMKKQLQSYGVRIVQDHGSTLVLNAAEAHPTPNNSEGGKTRGSFLVLGPLVARFGKAEVYQPGGCQIGKAGRPVNFHFDALEKMGATIEKTTRDSYIINAESLHGANINFPKVSVGATENTIMAACFANRQTVIKNAALEPEVIDLVDMLKKMGANIEVDENTRTIVINRVSKPLNGCTHAVIPDRIEAGTHAIAAAIAGGPLLLKMNPRDGQRIMTSVIDALEKAGVNVTWQSNGLKVKRTGPVLPVNITTRPYPDFPTDLIPQWVTFMTQANGKSVIKDTIYDNRFKHVQYLIKMGAKIERISDQEYVVYGGGNLKGCHVWAADLRGGVALLLAGMAAVGTTVVKDFHHVLRGYENIKEKLKECGAKLDFLAPPRQGFHGGL